jgi:hypothetical protein
MAAVQPANYRISGAGDHPTSAQIHEPVSAEGSPPWRPLVHGTLDQDVRLAPVLHVRCWHGLAAPCMEALYPQARASRWRRRLVVAVSEVRAVRLSRILVALAGIGAVSGAHAADSYLCVTDYSIGYDYDEATASWRPAKFQPKEKYLIRPLAPPEQSNLATSIFTPTVGVFPMGDYHPVSPCEWFNIRPDRMLVCHGVYGFAFNESNFRFQASYLGLYLYPPIAGVKADSPTLDIGKCSPRD